MSTNPKMLGAICGVAAIAGLYFTIADNEPGSIRNAEASLLLAAPPELAQPAAVHMPESPTAPQAEFGAFETIELQSRIETMTQNNADISEMIQRHYAARAARWTKINQDNLRAAAIIDCYQSGRTGCE